MNVQIHQTNGIVHPARLRWRYLAGAWLVLAVGCQKGGVGIERSVHTADVQGKVLLPDGSPMTGGGVRFLPVTGKGSEDVAFGPIQSDGSFTLKTMTSKGEQAGAVPGEYKVVIEPINAEVARQGGQVPKIAAKYKDEDHTDLLVTVQDGSNTLEPFRLQDGPDVLPGTGRVAQGMPND